EDRPGTHFAGNADWRGRIFASWGLHRGQGRGVALGCGHQPEFEGADFFGVEDAHASRRESHQDALWPGRRQRAYARGSGPVLRRNARTHPADRSEGAAQAAASLALAETAGVPGRAVARLFIEKRDAFLPDYAGSST